MSKTEKLYVLPTEERRRAVIVAADSGIMPPGGLLTYLADLGAATLASRPFSKKKQRLRRALIRQQR